MAIQNQLGSSRPNKNLSSVDSSSRPSNNYNASMANSSTSSVETETMNVNQPTSTGSGSSNFRYAFDIKIGAKIGDNSRLDYGYVSSDRAYKDIDKKKLNTNIITGDSIIYRVVLLDESGRVIENLTESGRTLESLVNEYGPERLIADVRDADGNPQAWIKVETLLDGVEKVLEETKPEPEPEKEINTEPVATTEPTPIINNEPKPKQEEKGFWDNVVEDFKSGIASAEFIGLGLVEGIGKFGEAMVDTCAMISDKRDTLVIKLLNKLNIIEDDKAEKLTNKIHEITQSFVSKQYVSDYFDEKFFNKDTFIGQYSILGDKTRKVTNFIGEIVPLAVATYFTGGAAAGAAGAAATAAGASAAGASVAAGAAAGTAVAAETFVATYGADAEANFNKGMSYEEGDSAALKSSGTKSLIAGLLSSIGWGIQYFKSLGAASTEIQVVEESTELATTTGSTEVSNVSSVVDAGGTSAGGTSAGGGGAAGDFIGIEGPTINPTGGGAAGGGATAGGAGGAGATAGGTAGSAAFTNVTPPTFTGDTTAFVNEAEQGLKILAQAAKGGEQARLDALASYMDEVFKFVNSNRSLFGGQFSQLAREFHPDQIFNVISNLG